ncbi:tripartite tricarboxylate transporter substrate binding protein [Cupriavidus sp. CV2]|uniref:tripartite tricarboxylate transporter substrate binding protein n=1 Tax=Cupriavidus ulmosensis TaxID=3065913 RepID=UPI00296B1606|nr:tripartite tricarboxylate transporter substrate binding protein [Cupriavidus sp. CV2]MDW3687890.1 tripartite tricarboxylate transporter substrate binding protein [Cupriavidus sp. CV2]
MLRRLAFALLLCFGLAHAPAASAGGPERYPVRPIKLIVPWPAGGATDISMRVLAELAGRELGQPIVVENKPGAGGTLVGGALAAARPDGYTIGQLPLTVYRFAHEQKTSWQPLRDIQPVLMISGYTFGIVVPADSQFHTLDDLIAWGRAHPGALTVGSTGIGTTAHFAMEDVLGRSGVRYVHVPYRGTADQMLAVANGSLMAGVNSTGFAPFVDSGRMRLLAVFSAQRSARWPDVPTVSELGFDHAIHNSPYGIGVPRGTDPLIVRRLHDALRIAMQQPRHVAELARYDQELTYLNTAGYETYLQRAWEAERNFAERVGTAQPKERL